MIKNLIFITLLSLSISLNGQEKKANILVAQDGSGDFTKVQDAIKAVPNNSSERTIICIKPGIYKEKILIPSENKKITLLGESYKNTILTYDDHGKINPDYASTKVLAEDFYAENITFQNTTDSRKGGSQAAALRIDADRAILYKCNITGFQDTFYLKTDTRSYIKDCVIDGTTDFIYGAGIALFENCIIRNRKDSHITASSQELGENKFGFVFKNCKIIKHPNEVVTNASLGRPWRNGANVVYLNCDIGSHIRPEGFSTWSTNPDHKSFNNIKTAYYALYGGSGYNPEKISFCSTYINSF